MHQGSLAIQKADYRGKNESGYWLLEDIATRVPYQEDTAVDRQLKTGGLKADKPSYRALAQRVILLGTKFLSRDYWVSSFELGIYWEDHRDRYLCRIDGDTGGWLLQGFAIFEPWHDVRRSLDVVLGAIHSLPGAAIRLGIVNISGQRSEDVLGLIATQLTPVSGPSTPRLAVGDYLMLVGLHTSKGWLYQL